MVSARERAREEVADALAGWMPDARLFWVSEPDLAPARAQDLVPHAIVVDDDLGGADAVSLIRQLAARTPGAAILALVEEEAVERARQAVLAGARGFVTKPMRAEDLTTTLRQTLTLRPVAAAAAEERGAAGRIVVFCAPKGGTGRTTLALNTAASLRATTRQSVVLVDADYVAPSLDVALNLHSGRNVADLLPRVGRLDEEVLAGVLTPHASGVQVLLAPPPADLSGPISLPQVQHILGLLRRMFAWVIVDLGIGMDETAVGYLEGADRAIVSVLPEMTGLRNAALLLEELRGRGLGPDKVWLVLNRATMRGGIGKRDIEGRLRMAVRHTVPDDQPLATHSINRGVPLVLSHRHSAVARAIGQLAEQLSRELSNGTGK